MAKGNYVSITNLSATFVPETKTFKDFIESNIKLLDLLEFGDEYIEQIRKVEGDHLESCPVTIAYVKGKLHFLDFTTGFKLNARKIARKQLNAGNVLHYAQTDEVRTGVPTDIKMMVVHQDGVDRLEVENVRFISKTDFTALLKGGQVDPFELK